MPFERLVQELHPARHAGHHPIFQTAFVLTPSDGASFRLDGLTCSRLTPPCTTAKFDLTLFVEESGLGLRAICEYRTELFDAETIDRLLTSLEVLLGGIVANPSTPLSRLPIITPAERARLLLDWNATERSFPRDRTVPELFASQVERAPDALAIVDGAVQVSYGALALQANATAQHLRERGVVAGSFVGLPAERSARFVAAALGIMQAGGAYVPLDLSLPTERLELLRAQCTCELDLTEAAEAAVAEAPPAHRDPESAAYVLFTSGTTGAPKGVIVPHRAITRLVINSDYAPLSARDVVAFASNVSFDAATFEIWGALLNGGTLVVTPHEVLLTADALAAHLAEHDITALFLTTALFHRFAQTAPATFRPLRYLLFGGEAANAACVQRVLESGKPERLVHVYGPTETTTFATSHLVTGVLGASVPIGRPIANTTAYLFDAHLQPVPIGVAGRTFSRRTRRGARLSPGARTHRGALHRHAARAALPHWRPRSLALGRHNRFPRSDRSPDQIARLSHRAGRDRVGHARATRGLRMRRADTAFWMAISGSSPGFSRAMVGRLLRTN